MTQWIIQIIQYAPVGSGLVCLHWVYYIRGSRVVGLDNVASRERRDKRFHSETVDKREQREAGERVRESTCGKLPIERVDDTLTCTPCCPLSQASSMWECTPK